MTKTMEIILLFFCYSFLGWLWETVYVSLRTKKFAYRGFLVGPITPIYGFAILGVLFLLQPFTENIWLLFGGAVVICSVVEYITSWGLEKLFNASWWDYHDVPFNINGRVALPISLFWGVCCVLISRIVHPWLATVVAGVIAKTGYLFPILFSVITVGDLIYTVYNMVGFKKIVATLNTAVEEKKAELTESLTDLKEQLGDDAEKYRQKLRERRLTWLQELKKQPEQWQALPKLNAHQKRWLRNFQRLDFKKIPLSTEELKELVRALQKKN